MDNEYNDLNNDIPNDEGLSHADKIAALAREPAAMFTNAAKYPINTVDWLLPLFIVLLFTIISSAIIMSVPEIKIEIKEKAKVQIYKRLDEKLKKGASMDDIVKERAIAEKQLDYIGSPIGLVFQSVSILVGGFIIFFFITAYFHLLFRYGFRADIEFKQSMFIVGITEYVSAINIFIFALISVFAKHAFEGLNGSMFFSLDKHSFGYFFLSKVDPLTIISFLLIGLGFAKFAKSENTNKFIIGSIGSWIGIGFIWFLAIKYVPFFKAFSS